MLSDMPYNTRVASLNEKFHSRIDIKCVFEAKRERARKLGQESEENWKNVQDIDFATELGTFFDIDSPPGRVVEQKTNNEGKNYFKVIQCWHDERVCVCIK